MSGPRNKYGVNDATNCYRTFNGQRFDHWMSCPSQEQIRSYRQAGIRCRRQGAELYVHTTDHNKAALILRPRLMIAKSHLTIINAV